MWLTCDNRTMINYSLVIYDNDITDAFFSCLTHLYTGVFTKLPSLYIALEKRCVQFVCGVVGVATLEYRINFTVEHLAAVSPAHQYFIQHLARVHLSQSGHRIRFTANQIAVNNITQCFQYTRNDQMVRPEDIIVLRLICY